MKLFVFALVAIAITSGEDGKPLTTQLLRQEKEGNLVEENTKICEPGTLSKEDCNTCMCTKDGTARVCTLMACQPSNIENTRVRRETTEKVCQPGETKMEDCNSCFCSMDGTGWGCTLMACPPKMICEPSKRYKKDCNQCACASDGLSEICTRKACPKDVNNPDGSLVNPDNTTINPLLRQKRQINDEKPCVPGTTFKRYCNTCHCGKDGITAGCTMMLCLEGVYNEDGTRNVPMKPLPLTRPAIPS